MRVVIASIPHTGTNFAKRLFRDKGWEDCPFNQEPSTPDAFNVGHIRDDDLFPMGLRLAEHGIPLICPFRHPYRVEESWRRQKRGSSKELVRCFQLLINKCLPHNPYILPVDSPIRERWLDEMAKGLGIPLKTDWEVINTKAGTFDMSLDEFKPSDEIIAFTKEINQFLGTYYGETRPNKRGRTRGTKSPS